MDFSYSIGTRQALIKIGLSQLPQISTPQMQVLGNPDIDETVRDTNLKQHITQVLNTSLPQKPDYEAKGRRAGAVGGSILGGLTGGTIGSAMGGGKGALIGSAIGGLSGGLGGARLGKGLGSSAYESDVGEQQRMRGVQFNDLARRLELAKQEAALRAFETEQQRDHEETLRLMPETRYNYNYPSG